MKGRFMKKYISIVLIVIGMVCLISIACTDNQNHLVENDESDNEVFDGHPPYLRLPIEGEISTIDPGLIISTTSIEIVEQLFLGLTDFDPNTYEAIPELAIGWSILNNGKIYQFALREDVYWTDGTPVTAHDIVWAIRRNINPKTKSPYAYVLYILKNAEAIHTGEIEDVTQIGVRAIDEKTVEFELNHAAAYFPAIAGLWVYRPLPSKTIEKYGENWIEPLYIQSNGAYKLTSWVDGSLMILQKNPGFINASKVCIPEIRFYIIPESYAGFELYKSNALDIIGGNFLRLPIMELANIKSNPAFFNQYYRQPLLCTSFYGFNTIRPPVDNVLVRKALSAAIDRALLIEVITKGDEEPATTFTRPPLFGSVLPSEGIGIHFDPTQAQKWLAEAGYPNGVGLPPITIMHNVSETHHRIANTLKSFMQHYLNITVHVVSYDWETYINAITGNNAPHIFRAGWCADYPDANNWLNDVFHPFKSQNMIQWNNREFAQLMDDAQKISDPEIRKRLYRRAEKILCEEEAAVIPIYFETAQYLVKPWVKDWFHMAIGGQHIYKWRFDKCEPTKESNEQSSEENDSSKKIYTYKIKSS